MTAGDVRQRFCLPRLSRLTVSPSLDSRLSRLTLSLSLSPPVPSDGVLVSVPPVSSDCVPVSGSAAPSLWRPEYGAYMVEGTPGQPYGSIVSFFNTVESNMRARRREVEALLQPDEILLSITSFPRSVRREGRDRALSDGAEGRDRCCQTGQMAVTGAVIRGRGP